MDIEAAKEKHKEFSRSLANVVGVGIGPKMRGGRLLCIIPMMPHIEGG